MLVRAGRPTPHAVRRRSRFPTSGLVGSALITLLVSMTAGSQPSTAQGAPILGAAIEIVADGSAPWEDRPIAVPGLGTLPGQRGAADPGDDTGARDRVVRTLDAVSYRVAFSLRGAPADDVVVEVTLSGPAVWESARLSALRLSTCRGGATLLDDERRLRCVVGRVEAPPAVTRALDLTARVSGSGRQGETIAVVASVRAPGVVPERERSSCPTALADGCLAAASSVAVSAAPAVELRKHVIAVRPSTLDGELGREVTWRLDAVIGADGDVRGTSYPVGAPWTLTDWWQLSARNGRTVELPVRLVGCTNLVPDAGWTCDQPGGGGTPVAVTIERLAVPEGLPSGVTSSMPQLAGALQIALWVPEAAVVAVRSDVEWQNCFATRLGEPGEAVWAPVDAQGQPNLGGLPEPLANNCAHVSLPVPRSGGRDGGRRPPSGPPGPGNAPTPRPRSTPVAVVSKRYTPVGLGAGITSGSAFAAEVAVRVLSREPLAGVVACDKWDNSTHMLRDGGVGGVRVGWQLAGGEPATMADDAMVVEYAAGSWGRGRAEKDSVGRGWYVQSTALCTDASAVAPPGWVRADGVDFLDGGQRAIDARDVNMVRVRFLDPLPSDIEVWLEVLLLAGPNRGGTWLMNYGAAAWGAGSRAWHAEGCDFATGNSSLRRCPEPPAGARGRPGPLGDMLVHVGVPLLLTKRNDPVVPGGSPILDAGQTTAFTLQVTALPRPDDPPPPMYPAGARAMNVVITDALPGGMIYVHGSATLASEDVDGDGVLGPGEDRNGNGRVDLDAPFEPAISPHAFSGETMLSWPIGDLPYGRHAPAIRFEARVSRLVPAGTSLTNWAEVAEAGGPPTPCSTLDRRPFDDELSDRALPIRSALNNRCAWAQVTVANSAAAQVEKVAERASVLAGEPMAFRLTFANLSGRPVETFDAVDILPRLGEPRDPASRIGGGFTDVQATDGTGWPPLEVWASAAAPDTLDTAGGGLRDGLVDPVAAWGDGGAGLRSADWPCLLADVGSRKCSAIRSRAEVTALRFWGADPEPRRSGGANESFLAAGRPPRYVDVRLIAPGSVPGDIAHNAWGGRFGGLPLPVFDDAVIRVVAPATATPIATTTSTTTATPSPSSATASPTVAATPTVTATATSARAPSATPSGSSPRRIYLPVSLRLPCSKWPVDVVLVIDLSTSMRRPAGDGGTKLEAVLRAATAFLDRFAPGSTGGRVAVVAFNVRAWIVQPLTGERSELDAALAGLPGSVQEGTRLDLGLLEGVAAFDDDRQRRLQAMVFLTDGLPNWVPTPVGGGRQEDTVLAAAAVAHARGVTIHTIGYGRADAPDPADRIAPELLRAIAGSDAGYHQTDEAGALAEVFEGIAAGLGCAENAGWPAAGERLWTWRASRQ